MLLPIDGIQFSVGSGGSGGTGSFSGFYDLDDSAALSAGGVLSQGNVNLRRLVAGSGENRLMETASGGGSSVTNEMAGSGLLDSSLTATSSDGGAMTSSSTRISGKSGFVESVSESEDNTFIVTGGFSGEGDLRSDLDSFASGRAMTLGTSSMLGIECYNEEVAEDLAVNDVVLISQGIYQTKGGLGEFGLAASNFEKKNGDLQTALSYNTGSETKGYLLNWRQKTNAQIPLLLAKSTVPLGYTSAAKEICKAANTWDVATHENLFRGIDSNNVPGAGAAVELTSYTPSYSKRYNRDYKNTQSWTTGFGTNSNIIALTLTWVTTDRNYLADNGAKYRQAVESDCWYNKNMRWEISPSASTLTYGTFDVRTLALHELGHTIGLGDLYQNYNSQKTMYAYNDGHADWTPSGSDKLGLWQLYGHSSQGDLT
ncbi:MAG: hypothetical protein LUQ38_03845 [Methanotrichaceae archaeon]|nr:hypothetical protein [Methanotrichaceae archaeon]